jgi:HSP20 family protein
MRLIPYLPAPARSIHWPQSARFLEEFFDDFPLGGSPVQNNERWVPAVDIMVKDGNLILRAELPGMDENEIELSVERQVLTLKGERKIETDEEKSHYRSRESHYGSFVRSFSLPETVESDKIKAEFKRGILTVTIPQKPEVQPRTIPVLVQ